MLGVLPLHQTQRRLWGQALSPSRAPPDRNRNRQLHSLLHPRRRVCPPLPPEGTVLSSHCTQGPGVSPLSLVTPSSQQLCRAARGPRSVMRRCAWGARAAAPTAQQSHAWLRAPARPDRSLWPRVPSPPITGGHSGGWDQCIAPMCPEHPPPGVPTSTHRTLGTALIKYHGGPFIPVV